VPRSIRRRVAVASWRPSRDGRIYTRAAIDATALLRYVEQQRVCSGERVTITHVVGAALARALTDTPEIRARVVLGRIVPYRGIDVAFAVDIEGGEDLAPVKVADAHLKSPVQICREVSPRLSALRTGQDRGHRRSTWFVRVCPGPLLRPLLAVAGFVIGGLGRPALGQLGSPLGTAFVSNVGTLGLDEAFLAPLPFARCPLYLAVGAVRDAPVVVEGQVAVRPQLVLVATADHRLVDGAHAGVIARTLRSLLADPDRLDALGDSAPW